MLHFYRLNRIYTYYYMLCIYVFAYLHLLLHAVHRVDILTSGSSWKFHPVLVPAYHLDRLNPSVMGLFFIRLCNCDSGNVWFDIKVPFCKGHDTTIIRHSYIIIVSLMPIV